MAELTVVTRQSVCCLPVFPWVMANSQTPLPLTVHPEHQLGAHSWSKAVEAVLHLLPPPRDSPGQMLLQLL